MSEPVPRVPPLSREQALAAAKQVEVPEAMAELNVFRILLHDPPVARAINDLLITLLFRSKLDHRLRELVIMRIGWATGADYEWTQHWRVARETFHVPDEDLLALRDWRGSDRFGAADRCVLAATDDTIESGRISPATWAECEKHLGPAELVDLVAAVGCWSLISEAVRSIGIPLEDGVASWPPDGQRPPAAS
jgi:4-carboxymuconolactone decarboxylase